jgi:hypothetical protein
MAFRASWTLAAFVLAALAAPAQAQVRNTAPARPPTTTTTPAFRGPVLTTPPVLMSRPPELSRSIPPPVTTPTPSMEASDAPTGDGEASAFRPAYTGSFGPLPIAPSPPPPPASATEGPDAP